MSYNDYELVSKIISYTMVKINEIRDISDHSKMYLSLNKYQNIPIKNFMGNLAVLSFYTVFKQTFCTGYTSSTSRIRPRNEIEGFQEILPQNYG